jgi:Ca2+-binding RTX toxin-like protein
MIRTLFSNKSVGNSLWDGGKRKRVRRQRNSHVSGRGFRLESLESRELMAGDFQAAVSSLAVLQTQTTTAVVSSQTTGVVGGTTGTVIADPTPAPVLRASFANGVLQVTGSHNADHLYIYQENGLVHVREVVQERTLLSVRLTSVKSILVNANGGNDWVTVDESLTIPATLNGDWGNDTLQGGSGHDHLAGGSGNDEILGRGGNDVIRGNHGDDLLVGGEGNDIIHGDAGNDSMFGGAGNDWMLGGDGNDQIVGEAGNDMMFGGNGENLMSGGAGHDVIYGGIHDDAIYGGDGDDILHGGPGDDRLRGEAGIDEIFGESGDDIVDGGLGNDYIEGGTGNDALHGSQGNDALFGGDGQDWLEGGDGADVLKGNAGNDYMLGGAGSDQLDGGTGSNKVFQDRDSSQTQYGTVTQSLSWDSFTEFVGDVWEGIVDVFKWTADKIQAITTRFYDWATHIDDRLIRFGGHVADALQNWPWKAEFWKDLGRAVIDAVEVVGLGEAWEIAFEILKPWQRGMTSDEINVARSVFGNSIPWDRVRLDEHSLMASIGRTHVTGYIINSTSNLDDRTMIHELTHVWQYVKDGLVYIPEALDAQAGEGYDYGGLSALRLKKAEGKGLSAFNREQQGEIVADYFEARLEARGYETRGLFAPKSLRDKLDVYIHFVKEVSTLTPSQLDTPDPFSVVRGTASISITVLAR